MKFKIKEAREKIGLSQKELAQLLNIKPTTFNGYETGAHDPKSEILIKIAMACDTSVDYLLGLEDKEQKKSPAPEKTAAEEQADLKRRTAFYRALVTLGYLREGEDIPDDRLEIAIHALQILDLAFRRADHAVDDVAHAG